MAYISSSHSKNVKIPGIELYYQLKIVCKISSCVQGANFYPFTETKVWESKRYAGKNVEKLGCL